MASSPSSSPRATPPSSTSNPVPSSPLPNSPTPQSSSPPATSSAPLPSPQLPPPPTATPPPTNSSPPLPPTHSSPPPPPTNSSPPLPPTHSSPPPPPTNSSPPLPPTHSSPPPPPPVPTSPPPSPALTPSLPLVPPPSSPLAPVESPTNAPPPSKSPSTSVSSPPLPKRDFPSPTGDNPPPASQFPPPPVAAAPTHSPPPIVQPPLVPSLPPPKGEVPQTSSPPPSSTILVPPSSSTPYVPPPPSLSILSPLPTASAPPSRSNSSATEGPSSSATIPSGSTGKPASKSSSSTTDSTGNSFPGSHGSDTTIGLKVGVAIGVVATIIVIGFVMTFVLVQKKKKKGIYAHYVDPSPHVSSQGSGSSFIKQQGAANLTGNNSGREFANSPSDPGGLGNSKIWFTYDELSTATNGFSSQNILGAGGFGSVYKGCLTDDKEVAVKKLKTGSGQGDREFRTEVEIISRVHHRHLVSLVGYCIYEYQRLLVYEFVPNNTLHHHLHAVGGSVMDWPLRVKVAAGSARGIAYLHEDCHPRIFHRDIKSANILLDNNFEAKVADFGLAKLAELDGNTHVSTRIMGTFGYMAPEYASSGKLTEKSDVFSFGVVLLELITGRKPVDETQPLGDESLVEWARPLLTQALETEEFNKVADPRLQGNYVRNEMFRMVEAAAACVRHSASKRPRMAQVVRALDSICEPSADLLNGVKPGQSEIFDSREQSVQIRMFQQMAFGSQEYSWMSGQLDN